MEIHAEGTFDNIQVSTQGTVVEILFAFQMIVAMIADQNGISIQQLYKDMQNIAPILEKQLTEQSSILKSNKCELLDKIVKNLSQNLPEKPNNPNIN